MRKLFLIAAIAVLVPAFGASTASAAAKTMQTAVPAWFTPAFKAKVDRAGLRGVRKPAAQPGALDVCPGVQPDSPTPATSVVSAGTCEVYPHGCTANFVYSNGTQKYIGTAGHCVNAVGEDVYMQVSTPGIGASIANVGTVSQFVNGGVGNDYAVIAIRAGFAVNPALPTGGPNGVYTGCGPDIVRHYGHGYGVAVAQGKQEGGLATNWYDDGFGWTGAGAPGDSGSAVLTASGLGAGDFTHLIVDLGAYPGSDLAGTRITKILAGTGLSLVNADGSTTPTAATSCGAQP
jgi:hypothetical protein